jgi:DNA-directed RNA polymerase specialized sigma24 family protein
MMTVKRGDYPSLPLSFDLMTTCTRDDVIPSARVPHPDDALVEYRDMHPFMRQLSEREKDVLILTSVCMMDQAGVAIYLGVNRKTVHEYMRRVDAKRRKFV